jgi:hypothetical protein
VLRGEGVGGVRRQLACEIIDFSPRTCAIEVAVDAVPATAFEYVTRYIQYIFSVLPGTNTRQAVKRRHFARKKQQGSGRTLPTRRAPD